MAGCWDEDGCVGVRVRKTLQAVYRKDVLAFCRILARCRS